MRAGRSRRGPRHDLREAVSTTDLPTVPNDGCAHKVADHRHGTHACYALDGCRCEDCRNARIRYETQRTIWHAGVRPGPFVDAESVRRHVLGLMDGGMSLKRVAERSGVANGTLWRLIYGRNGRPTRRVTRDVARRLLAVELELADGAKVPAAEAHEIVAELVARGWSKAEIGRRVHGPQAVALQLGDRFVTVRTLVVLRGLLDELVPPRPHGCHLPPPPPNRTPRDVPPSTPGVPVVERVESGKLACRVCGRPFAAHGLTEACWRSIA